MSRLQGIHWFAPATMLAGLVAGVLLAVGHHLFYQSLDQTPASEAAFTLFGSTISEQETNIAIGTALAFLVKASLVLAISVAFIQVFWSAARHSSATKPPTLAQLDSAFSAMDNVFVMFNAFTWWRSPLLLLLALAAWLLPIASIITPATLSIKTARVVPAPILSRIVPNLDFQSMNFIADMPGSTDDGAPFSAYTYNGPSQAVSEIANALMAQGTILPIRSPELNASWDLELFGPSLQCPKVHSNMTSAIYENIMDGYEASLTSYGYLAWVPQWGYWRNRHVWGLPFLAGNRNGSLSFTGDTSSDWSVVGSSIFVAQFPNMFTTSTTKSDLVDNILQCELHNSTYKISFRYVEGVQEVNIAVQPDTNPGLTPVLSVNGPVYGYDDDICTDAPGAYCYISLDTFKTLAYQAVMGSFTQNVLGSISLNTYDTYNNIYTLVNLDSNILDTTLAQTTDLSFLGRAITTGSTLQSVVSTSKHPEVKALITKTNTEPSLSLVDSMELMFQNLTVSLMSSTSLQPNYSSKSAPPPATVTFHKYHNIYIYSKWKLWLPYGIAILLTAIAVIVGFIAILLNGASYRDEFSTVFRVAKGAEIKPGDIQDEDLDGKDPMPKYLSKVKVYLRAGKHGNRGDVEYKRITPPNTSVDPSLRARSAGERRSDATLLDSPYWTANNLLRSSTRASL